LQLDAIEEKAAEEELAPVRAAQARALSALDRRSKGGEEEEEEEDAVTQTLDEEMETAGKTVTEELQRKQKEMLGSIDMMQYAVGGTDKDWDAGSAGEDAREDAYTAAAYIWCMRCMGV
jgi:N-acetyltransferase 10